MTGDSPTKTKRKRYYLSLILLLFGVMLAAILAIMLGPVEVPPITIIKIVCYKIQTFFNLGGLIDKTWSNMYETIVIDIRMPRVILAAMVGAGLAIAGAAMQGLFKNPMAEPYVLGMSSGAAVGAAAVIVLGLGTGIFGAISIQVMAFLGALITILVVYNIARVEGKVPVETLLLAGIAVGFFLYAIVSSLKFIASHEELRGIVLWLMGSFASSQWADIPIVAPLLLLGIVGLYAFSRELNAFQLGEETALHVGVEVEKIKIIVLGFAALITATGVSVSGIIGFVGLVIPHIVRITIGADHHILLPASALTGAIFMVLADTLARTIAAPAEVPVGIITALVGVPYFIYLLRKKKKSLSWW